MNKTGIALFTQDINWIVNQFKDPPLVSQRHSSTSSNSGYIVSAESGYLYGDFEIVIRNGISTFISVQNMWTMKYLTLTVHDPLIKIDDALIIAKQLIKKNKAILNKRSQLEYQPIYGQSLAQRLYPIWLANKKQAEIR